jgi:hypothetical protein
MTAGAKKGRYRLTQAVFIILISYSNVFSLTVRPGNSNSREHPVRGLSLEFLGSKFEYLDTFLQGMVN